MRLCHEFSNLNFFFIQRQRVNDMNWGILSSKLVKLRLASVSKEFLLRYFHLYIQEKLKYVLNCCVQIYTLPKAKFFISFVVFPTDSYVWLKLPFSRIQQDLSTRICLRDRLFKAGLALTRG
jgi:hypothetical protein